MHNPRWLASFTAVAEARSFTRAAAKLGVTQAAVSQHIAHLEDQLGPLLIRRSRHIELTPAGSALLEYGQEIDKAHKRLNARLSGAEAASGEISLITPGSVGLGVYPILLELQQAHRDLSIRHRFAPDHESLDAVLRNQYELGMVTLKPDDPRIASHRFIDEPLELVVPVRERVEDWHDLQRLGFIDHPDGQAMAVRLLSRYFPGNPGVRSLPCHGFINQIGLILEPVARGLGFTILPRHARCAFANGHAIRVLELGPLVVNTIWFIYRSEWPLSARAALVMQRLRERLPSFQESARRKTAKRSA